MTSHALFLLLPSIAAAAVAPSPFADLFFEPNRGQASPQARFIATAPGARLWFEAGGVRVGRGSSEVLLHFAGAKLPARWEPLDATPDRSFYFLGRDESKWTRNVPHYRRLAWRGVYPGVDAIFYGSNGRLEYDLVVAPGADTSRLRIRFEGAKRLAITRSGDLRIETSGGGFDMLCPRVYQRGDLGAEHAVAARYRRTGAAEVRFEVDEYDRRRELVVDPVLQFAAYYGAERDDSVVAVTAYGDVVGVTTSAGWGDGNVRGGKDVFVSVGPRPNSGVPAGTYGSMMVIVGGSDDDVATCAAASATSVIIGGWTRSKDFPGDINKGGSDGFLIELNRAAAPYPNVALVGGSGDDQITAMTGNDSVVYFAGTTNSADLRIGAKPAAGSYAGGTDVLFGSAFATSAYALGYYGGSGDDTPYAVLFSTAGLTIAGKTTSADLPTKDAISGQRNGPSDGFIASFSMLVSEDPVPAVDFALSFGSYFGGSGDDEIRGLAVASSTPPVLSFAGTTASTDLPLVNAAIPQYGGGESDAFAARLDVKAHALVYSTYIGGSGRDEASGIAVNSLSDDVVAGTTTSPDLPVTTDAAQARITGPQDAWYSSLRSTGAIDTVSYFGGSGSDRVLGMTLSADNVLTICGETDSPDLPASNTVAAGGLDGFVARLALPRFTAPFEVWTNRNLATPVSLFIPANVPDSGLLTLESSNPSVVLVGLDGNSFGGSVSIPARSLLGRPAASYTVYVSAAVDDGDAEVTATVGGLGSLKFTVHARNLTVQPFPGTWPRSDYFDRMLVLNPAIGVLDDTGRLVRGSLRNPAAAPTVTYSSSDDSIVSIAQPVFKVGDPIGMLLDVRSAGEVTLSATVDGAALGPPSSVTYTSKYPTLKLRDAIVAKDVDSTVPFESDGSLSSMYVITVTTESPDKICFPVGQECGASAIVGSDGVRVRGLVDSGTAMIRYSGPRVNSGIATVQLSPGKLYFPRFLGVGLTVGATLPVTVIFGPPDGSLGNLRPGVSPSVMLTSSDPKVLTVSAGTFNTDFRLQPLAPGTVTLRATAAGFIDSDPLEFVISNPRLREFSVSKTVLLGQNLQLPLYVGGSAVHARSSAPGLVGVSGDLLKRGGAEADSNFSGLIYLEALAASGSATVTFSAPGYVDAAITVRIAPAGFAWSSAAVVVAANATSSLRYGVYALDPDSLGPVSLQALAPGLKALPGIASSEPGAGDATITTPNDARFAARGAGSTTLTLQQPPGFTAPSVKGTLRVNVTTTAPSAVVPYYLGKDMQLPVTFTQGPAKFTVRSDDPTLLVLSMDNKSVGAGQLEVASNRTVYLQALAGEGVVNLRAVADGVADVIYPIVLVPAGVAFVRSSAEITTLSPDLDVSVILAFYGRPAYYTAEPQGLSLRPGIAPLEIGIVSSDPGVVRPLSATVSFTPGGGSTATFKARPGDTGEAVIQLKVPPAFHTSDASEQMRLKVRRPRMAMSPTTVGRDLMSTVTMQPDIPDVPGTVLVTLVSSDPSRVLLSTAANLPGQARVTTTYTRYQPPTLYVHGVTEGTAKVTVSATGFDDTDATVRVVPPTVVLSGSGTAYIGRTTTLTVSANGQMVRPGALLAVNLTSSDPAIATVTPSVAIEGGKWQAEAIVTALAEGSVTITADAAGAAVDSRLSITFKTEVPPLPFTFLPATLAIGRGLETSLHLVQSDISQVRVTITSSDPAKVQLSTDPKSGGAASVTVTVSQYQPLSVYVLALVGSGDVALTLTAAGCKPSTIAVSLYSTTLQFTSNALSTFRGGIHDISIYAAMVAPPGVMIPSPLWVHTPVTVPVASSRPEVGTVKPTAIVLPAGGNSAGTTFTAQASGTTTLTLTMPPGFVQSNPPSQMVVVVQ